MRRRNQDIVDYQEQEDFFINQIKEIIDNYFIERFGRTCHQWFDYIYGDIMVQQPDTRPPGIYALNNICMTLFSLIMKGVGADLAIYAKMPRYDHRRPDVAAYILDRLHDSFSYLHFVIDDDEFHVAENPLDYLRLSIFERGDISYDQLRENRLEYRVSRDIGHNVETNPLSFSTLMQFRKDLETIVIYLQDYVQPMFDKWHAESEEGMFENPGDVPSFIRRYSSWPAFVRFFEDQGSSEFLSNSLCYDMDDFVLFFHPYRNELSISHYSNIIHVRSSHNWNCSANNWFIEGMNAVAQNIITQTRQRFDVH